MNLEILEKIKALRAKFNYRIYEKCNYASSFTVSKGIIFVVNFYKNKIFTIQVEEESSEEKCFAIENPSQIAVDELNQKIFVISDYFSKIKILDFNGQIIKQVTFPSKVKCLKCLDVDEDGIAYVTDYYDHKIIKIDKEGSAHVWFDLKMHDLQCPCAVKVLGEDHIAVSLGYPERFMRKEFYSNCNMNLKPKENLIFIYKGNIEQTTSIPVQEYSIDELTPKDDIFYTKENVPILSLRETVFSIERDEEGNFYFLDSVNLIKTDKKMSSFEKIKLRERFSIAKPQVVFSSGKYVKGETSKSLFLLDGSMGGFLYRLNI